ncbi:poly-beta-1,6 N-acetyl-D-glucosamine synthase [Pannonibacter phragmitetus]|uniref:Poly-beta-1,6 N-acetyl-D-glucosamine synthase n=1 Tax=Pannonibacter phragmitetus TaxID=121719 RepID=A0A378ZPS8_9HYPH|nr:glycosyltransferase [Pannonibacter phragmitetus]SUA99137.1 poly-beta-1,6 N-acetyl-D-glucosamine synthase [Pannonibacter phragmitetus]
MNLGYVCTNFNGSAVTQNAIRTLRQIEGHEIHIVVVDNGSSPEQAELIKACQDDKTTILCLSENLGYFAGLNAGIKFLREHRPDVTWMVVGNNDLEFPVDFCEKLEAISPEIAQYPVISPDIVTMDGQHQNPHVITHISKIRELFYDLYYSNYHVGLLVHALAKKFRRISDRSDEQEWETARLIYQGHGSAYILSPLFFEVFEELWAPTFLMSEEFFLSKQLSDKGYAVYYDPRVTIRHLWHGTLGSMPSRRRWEFARDAHRVYRRYVKVF